MLVAISLFSDEIYLGADHLNMGGGIFFPTGSESNYFFMVNSEANFFFHTNSEADYFFNTISMLYIAKKNILLTTAIQVEYPYKDVVYSIKNISMSIKDHSKSLNQIQNICSGTNECCYTIILHAYL